MPFANLALVMTGPGNLSRWGKCRQFSPWSYAVSAERSGGVSPGWAVWCAQTRRWGLNRSRWRLHFPYYTLGRWNQVGVEFLRSRFVVLPGDGECLRGGTKFGSTHLFVPCCCGWYGDSGSSSEAELLLQRLGWEQETPSWAPGLDRKSVPPFLPRLLSVSRRSGRYDTDRFRPVSQ